MIGGVTKASKEKSSGAAELKRAGGKYGRRQVS